METLMGVMFSLQSVSKTIPECKIRRVCALIIWDCQLETQTWLILQKGREESWSRDSVKLLLCSRDSMPPFHQCRICLHFIVKCFYPSSCKRTHTLNVLWGCSEFCFYCSCLFSQDDKMFFLNNGRILPCKAPGGHSKNQTINYLVNKK